MNIEMHPVVSSNVKEIGYDEQSRTLRVGFKSGSSYDYANVPIEKFRGLRDSVSKTTYLNQHIKGQYPYKQI
jgi:hypothetical protein